MTTETVQTKKIKTSVNKKDDDVNEIIDDKVTEDKSQPSFKIEQHEGDEVVYVDEGELPESVYEGNSPQAKEFDLSDEALKDRETFLQKKKDKFLATAAQMKGLYFLIHVGKDPKTGKHQWLRRFYKYRDLTSQEHDDYFDAKAAYLDLENLSLPMVALIQQANRAKERAEKLKQQGEDTAKTEEEIKRINNEVINQVSVDPDVMQITRNYFNLKKEALRKGLLYYFGFDQYTRGKYIEMRDYLQAAEYREDKTPPF